MGADPYVDTRHESFLLAVATHLGAPNGLGSDLAILTPPKSTAKERLSENRPLLCLP